MMSRPRPDPELALLDLEAWDAPYRLSEEDLHAQAGADRPRCRCCPDEREDDR